jgi:hypothetical protein
MNYKIGRKNITKTKFNLVSPCKYSFNDLIKASNSSIEIQKLNTMTQDKINDVVKQMCLKADWYYKDVCVNGITYTSFSPNAVLE